MSDLEEKEQKEHSEKVTAAYAKAKELGGFDLQYAICDALLKISDILNYEVEGEPHVFGGRVLTDEEQENPFLVIMKLEAAIPSATYEYGDLAAIMLWQLQTDIRQRALFQNPTAGPPREIEEQPEWVSLRDFIRAKTDYTQVVNMPGWVFDVAEDLELVLFYFFHFSLGVFDEAIYRTCLRVARGVPLFRVDGNGAYTRVPFREPIYSYLSQKVEFNETCAAARENPGVYPSWTEAYFFKREHLTAHGTFFGDGYRGDTRHSKEATATLREAMHRYLRIPEDVAAPAPIAGYLNPSDRSYAPKLAAAIAAWQAVSSSPAVLRGTTKPKQAIIKWLRDHAAEHGLVKDDGSPNEQGIEEVAKVANWDLRGGASKTPGEEA